MSKKVLFINLGGIGDEIMFLPSIISYKKQFPNSHVTLALEERSACITELTDLIDATIFIEKTKLGMLKLLVKMWFGGFDTVVSSGSNKLISVLLFLSGIKIRVGYNSGKLSQKLLTTAVTLNKSQYAVKMYHDLVSSFTEERTALPEFNVAPREKRENTILIHPGVSKKSFSQGMIKTITPVEWAELVKELAKSGKRILLAGGKDDEETILAIKSKLSPEMYTDVTGHCKSIRDLAQLISSAETFVCSDSAPLHVAVGMNTKTFVFFGSTDYKKLIPENGLVIPLLNNYECPLRPCLWEHRQTSCEGVGCLKFDLRKVAEQILA